MKLADRYHHNVRTFKYGMAILGAVALLLAAYLEPTNLIASAVLSYVGASLGGTAMVNVVSARAKKWLTGMGVLALLPALLPLVQQSPELAHLTPYFTALSGFLKFAAMGVQPGSRPSIAPPAPAPGS